MLRRVRGAISSKRRAAVPICLGMTLLLAVAASPAWAKKPQRTITTMDGKPVRTVYIDANSATTADSGATQVAQDTCLTVVSKPNEADAVLELGMALPSVGLGQTSESDSITPLTRRKAKSKSHHGGVSATCSDGNQSGSCTSSLSLPTGDVAPEPEAKWEGNVGGDVDVTLVSAANGSQELWEPESHTKQSWSDQLRVAAGCPVCPGDRFNRNRYKTYRDWIQTECPGVLESGAK